MHKKGSWAYPINLIVYGVLLVIILLFYSVMFFGFDISKSKAPIVSTANYQDSTTLINLLNTNIEIENKNITIADAINSANNYKFTEDQLKEQINKLLNNLPKIEKKQMFYSLIIKKNDKEFLKFGEEVLLSKKYLKQELFIPLENKELALAELYLTCYSCNEEDVEVLA